MSRFPQPIDEESSNTTTSRSRSPLTFFLFVFALSLPFWVAGALITIQLLPGLPLSALMFVCPVTAALILVYREDKIAGVIGLLTRAFDCNRIRPRIWYVPIILLKPAVMVLSYGLLRWMGVPLPAPQFTILTALTFFLMFFVPALGEELGWSGYVTDPMQDRLGALQAGILLGLIESAWHIVPLLQAHRSPEWIAWWCLSSVAARVLMVWLYNNTGKSVFATALFHTMSNVSWLLFPIDGSHYDPRSAGLIATLAAALVTIIWGPRTLARYRAA